MRRLAYLVLFALSATAPAFAADMTVPSKIEAVTVFPSGAEVTRGLRVKLGAGDHTILVDDVAGEAVAASIRVEAEAGGAVQIGSVDARVARLASTDPEVALSARKKLEDQIQALRDQFAAQDDIIKVATLQQTYLDNLARLPQAPGAATAGAQAPQTDWRAVFGVIGESMTNVRETIATAKLKQREIQRAIEDVQKQLEAATSKGEQRTQVRIHVSAAAPVEAMLRLRYQVRSASWNASYDARLATEDARRQGAPALALVWRASIQQKTGEDWDDVSLALSTTRPGANTAAPKLRTLLADFDPNAKETATLPPSEGDTSKTKPEASVAMLQTTRGIPGKTTIKSTGEAKRLQTGEESFAPSLVIRTVPRLDDTAYLYARFTLFKTSAVILPGQVSLFRDGVFVGSGQFPQLVPGEEHELGFGADERVKVRRTVLDVKKGETGTFTKSFADTRRYAIALKNLHARPLDVQVIDRAPVAVQADIKVEFSVDKGPQPNEKDLEGRRGTYMWQLRAGPDEEKQIEFSYRVTVPGGKRVLYREPRQEELDALRMK